MKASCYATLLLICIVLNVAEMSLAFVESPHVFGFLLSLVNFIVACIMLIVWLLIDQKKQQL